MSASNHSFEKKIEATVRAAKVEDDFNAQWEIQYHVFFSASFFSSSPPLEQSGKKQPIGSESWSALIEHRWNAISIDKLSSFDREWFLVNKSSTINNVNVLITTTIIVVFFSLCALIIFSLFISSFAQTERSFRNTIMCFCSVHACVYEKDLIFFSRIW